MGDSSVLDLIGWVHPDLYVGPSWIDGIGLYSGIELERDVVVIRFGGVFFPVSMRYDYDVVAPGSTVGISDHMLLAESASENRDRSDFINHSCNPNLGMLDSITLVTLRRIGAHDELTADYAYWESDEAYVMKQECRCSNPCCRRQITGTDWRLDLDHLVRWSSPFIKRRIV